MPGEAASPPQWSPVLPAGRWTPHAQPPPPHPPAVGQPPSPDFGLHPGLGRSPQDEWSHDGELWQQQQQQKQQPGVCSLQAGRGGRAGLGRLHGEGVSDRRRRILWVQARERTSQSGDVSDPFGHKQASL